MVASRKGVGGEACEIEGPSIWLRDGNGPGKSSDAACEMDADKTDSRYEPPQDMSNPTTLMIRHLATPKNKNTIHKLIQYIHRLGYGDAVTYAYMAANCGCRRNRGYAFVDFTTHEIAKTMHGLLNSVIPSPDVSSRALSVCYSKYQGVEGNLWFLVREVFPHKRDMFNPCVRVEGKLQFLDFDDVKQILNIHLDSHATTSNSRFNEIRDVVA